MQKYWKERVYTEKSLTPTGLVGLRFSILLTPVLCLSVKKHLSPDLHRHVSSFPNQLSAIFSNGFSLLSKGYIFSPVDDCVELCLEIAKFIANFWNFKQTCLCNVLCDSL